MRIISVRTHFLLLCSKDGRTYKNVFDEWKQTKLNTYDDKAKADRTVEYAGLYSLDYFGSMIFDRISTQDFYQYWDWRKVNFKRRKPSDDTLNRERSAIMSIFKFGYQRGYVKELLHIPKLKTNGINRKTDVNAAYLYNRRRSRVLMIRGRCAPM